MRTPTARPIRSFTAVRADAMRREPAWLAKFLALALFGFATLAGAGASEAGFSDTRAADSADPAAPTNLVYSMDQTRVDLRWSDNSVDETGFRVLRATDDRFTAIAEVPANDTVYFDSEARPGMTYRYQVRAMRGKNLSEPSNTIVVVMPTPLPTSVKLILPEDPVPVGKPVALQAETSGPVVSVLWSVDSQPVARSATPCGTGLFCTEHVFLASGPVTVGVIAEGDLGQQSFDQGVVIVKVGPAGRID